MGVSITFRSLRKSSNGGLWIQEWLREVHGLRGWEEANILLSVVEFDGKVLPRCLVHGNRVQRLAIAIKNLEVVLVRGRLANDLARLKLDLVGAVVSRLMPYILHNVLAPSNQSSQ